MVSHPRTSSRPDHVRPVNEPQPARVQVQGGRPSAVIVHRHWQQVAGIQETWIIEDEWWREPISRHYFALLLENGAFLTVFHDRIADSWFTQTY